MLLVIATARIPEGAIDGAHDALSRMILASREEAGCIDYCYAMDILEPGLMRITEKWQDEDALKFHFATPHMAEFQAAIRDIGVEIVELAKFQADDGKPLF